MTSLFPRLIGSVPSRMSGALFRGPTGRSVVKDLLERVDDAIAGRLAHIADHSDSWNEILTQPLYHFRMPNGEAFDSRIRHAGPANQGDSLKLDVSDNTMAVHTVVRLTGYVNAIVGMRGAHGAMHLPDFPSNAHAHSIMGQSNRTLLMVSAIFESELTATKELAARQASGRIEQSMRTLEIFGVLKPIHRGPKPTV
jgi:hypothetical protein